MSVVYTALLVIALLLSAAIGRGLRLRLNERHRSEAAVDSIRLVMGMLVTFTALVLGLLTSNAKQRFDRLGDSLGTFGTDLIELDHRLRNYGVEADDIRKTLRSYTAAVLADSWPEETPPSGVYPRFQHDGKTGGLEVRKLGQMLSDVDVRIEQLAPEDEFHRNIAERLRDRVASTIQKRWSLIFSAGSNISWPFLLVLTSWLCIIYAIFGLTSPPSRVVYAIIALSAFSIASPLYLILNYDQALNGSITLPSGPMRAALLHMDDPDEK